MNDLSNLLLIVFVFVALLSGIILIVKSSSKRPTLLLGLFVLTFSAEDVFLLIERFLSDSISSQLMFLPIFHVIFLAAPLLYLYTKNLVKTISWEQEKIHLIPGIIEFFLFTILFFFATDTQNWNIDGQANHWMISYIFLIVFNFFYYYKTFQFVSKCKNEIQNFYSTVTGKLLIWVKYIVIALVGTTFIWIGAYTSVAFLSEQNVIVLIPYLRILLDVANLILIIYITLMGLKQAALLEFSQIKFEELQSLDDKEGKVNHAPQHETNQFYERILEYMEEKEPFTDSNLTLASLALDLNTPSRKLSTLIKQETSYNFNQFINNLRVEKAKELLISPKYSHYTILGIAEEVGFNSKATFNTSFKGFTKMTPSQYKKKSHVSNLN